MSQKSDGGYLEYKGAREKSNFQVKARPWALRTSEGAKGEGQKRKRHAEKGDHVENPFFPWAKKPYVRVDHTGGSSYGWRKHTQEGKVRGGQGGRRAEAEMRPLYLRLLDQINGNLRRERGVKSAR